MTTPEFDGRLVLVTGAAQGIGLAVAEAFAARGARLAMLDRDAPRLEAEAHRLGALALVADLARPDDIDAALDDLTRAAGVPDVLAQVAGVLRPGSALESSPVDWQATFAVNTWAVVRLCQAIGAGMAARRRGAIVTVGSNAAGTPRTGMAAYAASKAATAQYMRCLALELAPHGVRCNLVSPGSTDTAMQRALWHGEDRAAAVIAGSPEAYRLGIPLQRLATPADIAESVCFLASDRARHITMHDLRVDGGATFDA